MVHKQELYEKHPELFHYTSREGLVGILASQKIWATHYKSLNDSSELQVMRVELAERLFPFLQKILVERYLESGLKEKTKMRKAGGPTAIARDEAERVATSYYSTMFEDSPFGRAVAVPYITSFCAHTSDQKYEQKNGLLSQWRGYARGGYAIVFDTRRLCHLYRLETEKYYYTTAQIGDVVYQGDIEGFEEEFGEAIEKIKTAVLRHFETGSWEAGETFGDVLSMFTRLKHRGFFEEREVRCVTFPMTKEIEGNYERLDPTYVSPAKPMKKIHIRQDGAPYIETFDFDEQMPLPTKPLPAKAGRFDEVTDLKSVLSKRACSACKWLLFTVCKTVDLDHSGDIKRIIVGPQENQARSKKEINDLIGKKIEVHCSETPLSWPSG